MCDAAQPQIDLMRSLLADFIASAPVAHADKLHQADAATPAVLR